MAGLTTCARQRNWREYRGWGGGAIVNTAIWKVQRRREGVKKKKKKKKNDDGEEKSGVRGEQGERRGGRRDVHYCSTLEGGVSLHK